MNEAAIRILLHVLNDEREQYVNLARTASASSQSRHRMAGKAAGLQTAIEKLRKASGL